MFSASHSPLLIVAKTTGDVKGGRLLTAPSYSAMRQKGHGGAKRPTGKTITGGKRWLGRLVSHKQNIKNWKYDKPKLPTYAFGAEGTTPSILRAKAMEEYFQTEQDFEDAMKDLGVSKHFDETVAVWYNTNDLRLHDHYPCALAVDEAEARGCPLVAMFCFDIRTFAQPSLLGGFYRQSPIRARFLIDTVTELRESFRKNGTELFVRVGFPEVEIPLLARQLGCAQVFASTQYAPHEKLVQDRVRKELTSVSEFSEEDHQSTAKAAPATTTSILKTVWNTTLVHVDDLTNPVNEMPDRFRLYWDENQAARIRPTNPYDCADGRILSRLHKKKNQQMLNPILYDSSRLQNGFLNFGEECLIPANNSVNNNNNNNNNSNELRRQEDPLNLKSVSVILVGPQSEAKYGVISNSGSLGEIMKQKHRTILLPPTFSHSDSKKVNNNSNSGDSDDANVESITSPSSTTTASLLYNIVPSGALPRLDEHLGYGNGTDILSLDDNGDTCFGAGERHVLDEHLPKWLANRGGLREYAALGDVTHSRIIQHGVHQGKVSAWLANGALSPRKLYEVVREFSFNKMGQGTTEYAVRELHMRLARRDFWHFQGVKYGRAFFFPFGPRPDETDDVADPRYDKKIVQRWCSSLTGIPFVDASMKELMQTGWCNIASRRGLIWTLTRGFGQDWRLGAEWLERNSVDYDPFQCYGNCMYEAGILKDRFGDKPRSVTFLANNVDGTGVYTKRWLPVLTNVPDFYLHRVHVMTPKMQKMHGVVLGKNYPYPVKLWDGAMETEALPLPAYFTDLENINKNEIGAESKSSEKINSGHDDDDDEMYEKDLANRFDNCTREKQLREKISSVHVDARRGSNMLDNRRVGWGEAKRHNKNLQENQLVSAHQYYYRDQKAKAEKGESDKEEENKNYSLLMKKSEVFPLLSQSAVNLGDEVENGTYQPVFADETVLQLRKKERDDEKLKTLQAQMLA